MFYMLALQKINMHKPQYYHGLGGILEVLKGDVVLVLLSWDFRALGRRAPSAVTRASTCCQNALLSC